VINALLDYDSEAAKKYAEANDLAGFILKNIAAGRKEKILERMSKDDYDFYIPFLAKQIDEFKDKMGALKDFKVQGTVSFPWDPGDYRTNIILNFEKGSTDMFLGWQAGKLSDVTTETGQPFPLILTLVPQSKTQFSTFEFVRAKSGSVP
jgi:hypothetical protein